MNELQSRMMLYFTGVSRESARIIKEQVRSASSSKDSNHSLHAMHEIKRTALEIKEYLFKADLKGISELVRASWEAKKRTSTSISNAHIELASNVALEAGAEALKVSGAGGGGFMMIFAEPIYHMRIKDNLQNLDGYVEKFQFTSEGTESWAAK